MSEGGETVRVYLILKALRATFFECLHGKNSQPLLEFSIYSYQMVTKFGAVHRKLKRGVNVKVDSRF